MISGSGGAALILDAVMLYGLIGAGFAVAFLIFGVERVSPPAVGAVSFRLLLVPGLVLLWPLAGLAWSRRLRGEPARPLAPEGPHRLVWMVLALLLPVLIVTSLTLRGTVPATGTAQRLGSGEAGQ